MWKRIQRFAWNVRHLAGYQFLVLMATLVGMLGAGVAYMRYHSLAVSVIVGLVFCRGTAYVIHRTFETILGAQPSGQGH